MNHSRTWKICVTGRVQGVGFRPLVCRLARKLALTGTVKNVGGVVEIIAQGSPRALLSLMEEIKKAPLPIEVENMEYEELEHPVCPDFHAIESDGEPAEPIFPADIAICDTCQKELEDPDNRHFHYPYISCTACGPRYTIIETLPYDREHTTMKDMDMCESCQTEYTDLDNRRCHGETISCPHCGPQLREGGAASSEDAMEKAIRWVREGKIILVKAMGGYQLVCRSDREDAVQRLRQLKHRDGKPFALMVFDLAAAEEMVSLSEEEKMLLTSPVRPIVLATKKESVRLYPGVADRVPALGVFLPSTGFYRLLTKGVHVPLIVTSCNRSGEPMIFKDEEVALYKENHTEVQGLFTYHRDILRPADDSVMKVVGKKVQVLRRTRGFLPEPVLRQGPVGTVLATGADMEPGFCLSGGGRFYPCQVPCTLDNEKAEHFLKETEMDWERMLGIVPKKVVSDLHPRYLSSLWGRELASERQLPFLSVQHHHAHALSVMAEHHISGKALAFVFDGTGYGTDGTIWGGEILLCEGNTMKRVGHLTSLPMIGGDGSMKQAWKTALCYLAAGQFPSADPRYDLLKAALDGKINTISSSSMGRLFDGVTALLGIATENRFKGECPMALEAAAQEALRQGQKGTKLHWTGKVENGELLWNPLSLVESLLESHDTIEEKALGFHEALVEMIHQSACYFGLSQIILSGGCFANGLLLSRAEEELKKSHFQVYTNEKVPCGDGGIALGQAFYAVRS